MDPAGNIDAEPSDRQLDCRPRPRRKPRSPARPPSPTNQTSATFTFNSERGRKYVRVQPRRRRRSQPVRAPRPTPGSRAAPGRFWSREGPSREHRTRLRRAAPGRIDLVGAATQILTAPPSPTNSTSASFTFTASEPGTDFECSLDGALFSQCARRRPTAVSRTGAPLRRARGATSPSTNTGPEVSHTWRVDARAPSATVASGPPGSRTADPRPSPSRPTSPRRSSAGSTEEHSLPASHRSRTRISRTAPTLRRRSDRRRRQRGRVGVLRLDDRRDGSADDARLAAYVEDDGVHRDIQVRGQRSRLGVRVQAGRRPLRSVRVSEEVRPAAAEPAHLLRTRDRRGGQP